MLIAVGNKVKFISTGDIGVVEELLEDGMMTVRLLESDIEIPAFVDDVERLSGEISQASHTVKFVPNDETVEGHRPEENQFRLFRSEGLLLAFEPIRDKEGDVKLYDLHILNTSEYDMLVYFQFSVNYKVVAKVTHSIPSSATLEVGTMVYDQLNDRPDIDVEMQLITTAGLTDKQYNTLKIKPQQFFKKLRTAPILLRQAYVYSLFDNPAAAVKDEEAEDLRTYTENIQRERKRNKQRELAYVARQDVQAYAGFIPEVDLHAEHLTPDHRKMKAGEILQLQLREFESFLSQAVQLNYSPVYVIHGLGKGKLRNEIQHRLTRNPHVAQFKNEFHSKYGFGATEVHLKR